MRLANNPENHKRTKHIDIRYHYIRKLIEQGAVQLIYLQTNEIPADGLTKPLPRLKYQQFISLLGLTRTTA